MVNLIVAVVVEPLPALFFDFFLGFALAGGDVFGGFLVSHLQFCW